MGKDHYFDRLKQMDITVNTIVGNHAHYRNPAGTYDDPTAPAGLLLPKFKRPSSITDAVGKIVGARDEATREKGTRIFREVDSQEVDRDTGGSTKRRMGFDGPFDNPLIVKPRSNAPVPDWSGYQQGRVNI